jgi:hypothetical protein
MFEYIREMNIHAMRLGPGKHLKGLTLLGGLVKPEEFDYFHEVCCSSGGVRVHLMRLHSSSSHLKSDDSGLEDILMAFWQVFPPVLIPYMAIIQPASAGGVIGLPPVLNYGSPEVQALVVSDVLQAKKFICLAITEAFAGSDVSGIQTTARKEGNQWVINGTKK